MDQLRVVAAQTQRMGALKVLRAVLTDAAPESGKVTLGFPGGSQVETVRWNAAAALWCAFGKETGYHWNVFGLEYPPFGAGGMIDITAEVNIPAAPGKRNAGGAFAVNASGDTFLLHRGRVNTGVGGIGQAALLAFMGDALIEVDDGGKAAQMLMIGALDDTELPHKIRAHVSRVAEFKRLAKGGFIDANGAPTAANIEPQFSYFPEPKGEKKYTIHKDIVASATHAKVVEALRAKLTATGKSCGNDKRRDLFEYDKKSKKVLRLYEVKSDATSTSIYTAIGQLHYHCAPPTERVMVLPAGVADEVVARLSPLGIKVWTFKIGKVGTTFSEVSP